MNLRKAGSLGEQDALNFLYSEGYHLRDRNFQTRRGELDLVMESPEGALVFIEVKTDYSGQAGTPESWISARKMTRIQRTAQAYCAMHKLAPAEIRYDVVTVAVRQGAKTIRHIPNAFLPDTDRYY
jgi:putative endonuclease